MSKVTDKGHISNIRTVDEIPDNIVFRGVVRTTGLLEGVYIKNHAGIISVTEPSRAWLTKDFYIIHQIEDFQQVDLEISTRDHVPTTTI